MLAQVMGTLKMRRNFDSCEKQVGAAFAANELAAIRKAFVVSAPNGKFCLDTVFVVGSRKGYTTGDASSIQGLGTSQDYRDLTLDRLSGGESFVFYRGATVNNPVEEMYSFVPAREWGTQGCGERCVLDFTKLPSGGMFNLARTRNFSIASCNPNDAPKVWGEIRDYVLNAGYWLGVEFMWPTRKYAGGKIV